MKTYAAVFLSVFLAELGDKTQLATLLFAAAPGVRALGVFAAAAAALLVSTALAVAVGGQLGQWVAPRHLKVVAGLAFLAIGAWMLLDRG
jgi:putative Ca2+/H+ antiporter (TMEM165/GDT1 family)